MSKASCKPLIDKQRQVVKQLQIVRQQGFELVAVDPSVGLTYRDEYCQRLGAEQVPTVLLLQEWLSRHLDELKLPQGENPEKRESCFTGSLFRKRSSYPELGRLAHYLCQILNRSADTPCRMLWHGGYFWS